MTFVNSNFSNFVFNAVKNNYFKLLCGRPKIDYSCLACGRQKVSSGCENVNLFQKQQKDNYTNLTVVFGNGWPN